MTEQRRTTFGLTPGLARFFLQNRTFLVVWLALFVSIAGIAMVSPLLAVFAQDMGASGIWLGLAFSGFSISQIPLMLLIGRLSDRFSKRLFLWLGLLIFAIAPAGYFWSPSYKELVFFRIFSGAGSALVIPTAYAYVGELAPRGHEGRHMGVFNIAMIAGFGIGPVLGGMVYDRLGMDATFLSMGILSSLGFLVAFFFLPGGKSSLPAERHKEVSTPFRVMLKDKTTRGIVTFQLVMGLSYGAVLAFLGIFMTSEMEANLTMVGIVMSMRAVLNGTLAYPFGWLADRMSRVFLASAGLLVVGACSLFVPWAGSFAVLLVVFVVLGTFESMASPSINAITVGKGREFGMGSVMGVFNMAMSTGLLTGALVGGAIDDSYGTAWVFRYAALCAFAGVAVFNMFMSREGQG
jgi:DHA1 family multidrug resistance protein-like MFS transporter